MRPVLSVIIPANNEEAYIQACLRAVLEQDDSAGALEVVVAANACQDRTVELVMALREDFAARGHHLRCLDLPEPGKIPALQSAEAVLQETGARVYLDADVRCDAALLGQIRTALAPETPIYATGTLAVVPPQSWITRHYARFWQRLPFVKGGAVGAGFFAVNAAGRARWEAFPQIISDDTYVRLQFEPAERVEVPARYHWPMVEGLGRLIRVRRRQDQGVQELAARWPDLIGREGKAPLSGRQVLGLALRDPVGFCVYGGVSLAVRLGRQDSNWTRGR